MLLIRSKAPLWEFPNDLGRYLTNNCRQKPTVWREVTRSSPAQLCRQSPLLGRVGNHVVWE